MSDLQNETKSLSEFAFFLRNIAEGFRAKIQNKVNADGVFLDIESELNAVANWDLWHNHRTLPDIISTDEETLRTTTAQFESILNEIRQGVLDQDGNQQYLHYADIQQLIEYFKKKYPYQAEFITQTFESFSHEINSVDNKIASGFNANKETRKQSSDSRSSNIIDVLLRLLELTAQTLDKSPSLHN